MAVAARAGLVSPALRTSTTCATPSPPRRSIEKVEPVDLDDAVARAEDLDGWLTYGAAPTIVGYDVSNDPRQGPYDLPSRTHRVGSADRRGPARVHRRGRDPAAWAHRRGSASTRRSRRATYPWPSVGRRRHRRSRTSRPSPKRDAMAIPTSTRSVRSSGTPRAIETPSHLNGLRPATLPTQLDQLAATNGLDARPSLRIGSLSGPCGRRRTARPICGPSPSRLRRAPWSSSLGREPGT